MFFYRKQLLFCICLFASGYARASDTITLSLSKCIDYALANNLDIQSAKNEVMSSLYAKQQALYNFLPQTSITTGYNYSWSKSTNAYTFQEETFESWKQDYGINASIPIFNGLQNIHGLKNSKLNLAISQLNNRSAELQIVSATTRLYFDILQKRSTLEIQNKSLGILRQQANKTEAIVLQGRIHKNDLLTMRALLLTEEFEYDELQQLYEIDVLKMLNIIALDSLKDSVIISFSNILPRPIIEWYNTNDANRNIAQYAEEHPEVVAEQKRIELQELNLKSTRLQVLPSINSHAGYTTSYSSSASDSVPVAGSNGTWMENTYTVQLENNLQGNAGVSVSFPINFATLSHKKVQIAKIQKINSEINYKKTLNSISESIEEQKELTILYGKQKISLNRSLEYNREIFEAVSAQYNANTMSITDYLQAKNRLIEAEYLYSVAELKFLMHLSLLEILAGKNIQAL